MLTVTRWDQNGVDVDYEFTTDAPKFREALFETCKQIRQDTNKDIVITLSGGSDSTLVKWCFDYLGIETKTIHQRYWHGDTLINESESACIEHADIYQDIDMVKFQYTPWYQEKFVNYVPITAHLAVQMYVETVLNPETDFIVVCGIPPGIYKFRDDVDPVYAWVGAWGCRKLALARYESCGIFHYSPMISSSWFDSLFKKQVSQVRKGVWENQFKKTFYDFHFPEIDHLPKTWVHEYPYFKDLTVEQTKGKYIIAGEQRDVYAQRTRLQWPLEEVMNGGKGHKSMDWIKDINQYEGFQ